MKIGKETVPGTAISTADEDNIYVRGMDLSRDLIGNIGFSEYFYLMLTGKKPSDRERMVLDATLVAIAEHGLVPSVQASRMTMAAAPDAMQGAVAAGILGCGSVILGAAENAGKLFCEVEEKVGAGDSLSDAAAAVLTAYRNNRTPVPGYGHPLHKKRDPRVDALFEVARNAEVRLDYVNIANALEDMIPEIIGKPLKLNVSAAIPAVLLGIGFPVTALRGVPILARTAGLIAHLNEEISHPIGFALSYQATVNARFLGGSQNS